MAAYKHVDYSLDYDFKLSKIKSKRLVKRAERAGYVCELDYLLDELKQIIKDKTK